MLTPEGPTPRPLTGTRAHRRGAVECAAVDGEPGSRRDGGEFSAPLVLSQDSVRFRTTLSSNSFGEYPVVQIILIIAIISVVSSQPKPQVKLE